MKFKPNIFLIIFVFMGYFLLFFIDLAYAEQCHIVRIAKETRSGTSRIYPYPQELKIPKGSCVIWASWITGEKVSISFNEYSKTCTIGNEFASGFTMKKACFLTELLSYGQTASILFNEKGVFTYQLELPEDALEEDGLSRRKLVREGKIIVE